MPSFEDILDKPASEVERPKPLPPGTYLCIVDGQPEFGKSNQKQTPFVKFGLKVLQPQDDVDHDQIAEIKGGVSGRTMSVTFYLTEDALYRLADKDGTGFLDHLGTDSSQTLRQRVAEAPGNQVLASVGHRPSQDGSQIYAEVKNTAKP